MLEALHAAAEAAIVTGGTSPAAVRGALPGGAPEPVAGGPDSGADMHSADEQGDPDVAAAAQGVGQGQEGGCRQEEAGELGIGRDQQAERLAEDEISDAVGDVGADLGDHSQADGDDEERGQGPAEPVQPIEETAHVLTRE